MRTSLCLLSIACGLALAAASCSDEAECDSRERCTDGRDNDCDGLVDCRDDDCAANPYCLVETLCDDGLDNEGDGATDCADNQCFGQPGCQSELGWCDDELDNDADGCRDEADVDCGGVEANCVGGGDDDCDGLTDCQDPDCTLHVACAGLAETNCADGLDSDSDGLTDCFDPNCWGRPGCHAETGYCADQVDNDLDGCADGVDADCGGVESACTGGADEDCDGLTDCDDADCASDAACIVTPCDLDPGLCADGWTECDPDQLTLRSYGGDGTCTPDAGAPGGYTCAGGTHLARACASDGSRACYGDHCSHTLAGVRAVADGLTDLLLERVWVSYVGLTGFYVQAERSGPGLYVDMGPAWTPALEVGDRVALAIAELATVDGHKQVLGDALTVTAVDGHTDSVEFLVQDLLAVAPLGPLGEALESELVRVADGVLWEPSTDDDAEWVFDYGASATALVYYQPGLASLTPAGCSGMHFDLLAPVAEGRLDGAPIVQRLRPEHAADFSSLDASGCGPCAIFDSQALIVDPVADGATGETYTVSWAPVPMAELYDVRLYNALTAALVRAVCTVVAGQPTSCATQIDMPWDYYFRVRANRTGCTAKQVDSNTFVVGHGAAVVASGLLISEYRHSGTGSAIEIFNGTGANSTPHQLAFFFDGSGTSTSTVMIPGLPHYRTYLVCDGTMHTIYPELCQNVIWTGFPTGDDAIVLRSGLTTIVDSIGRVGSDPGSAWTEGGLSTANMTLRRKCSVHSGDAVTDDAYTLAGEWDGYPNSDLSGLGSHALCQ